VLTANNNPQDKVLLLDGGADDYLTKPFSVDELLARIRVCLRHSLRSEQGPVVVSGPLSIDLFHRIVKVNDKEVKLTNTEYELLRILAQNIGRVVTQQQLLREVWGPRASEFTHYLRVYIAQLRKKIEKIAGMGPGELIHTETGVGYRLTWKN
jgi:two-component system KDP operon response regulator KdpE